MTLRTKPPRSRAETPLTLLAIAALATFTACAVDTAPASQSAPAADAASASQSAPAATAVAAPETASSSASSAPTSAETAAGAQATAVSQAAAGREQASAAALVAYRVKVGISLQSYANALGALREADRRIGERTTLVADAEWLARARTALRQMEQAAEQMTEVTPVPPEMALTDGLLRQLEDETVTLSRDYALGLDQASPVAIAAAGQRTAPVSALLARANIELRKGAA